MNPLSVLGLSVETILAVALMLVLIVEQLAPVTSVALSRSQQEDVLKAPPPPPTCRSFYVVHTRRVEVPYHDRKDDALYPHNVDAMLLAALWHVPTLNGYATFLPPDWAFADRAAPDYDARALRYIAAHGLRDVCRFDARSSVLWRRAS